MRSTFYLNSRVTFCKSIGPLTTTIIVRGTIEQGPNGTTITRDD